MVVGAEYVLYALVLVLSASVATWLLNHLSRR